MEMEKRKVEVVVISDVHLGTFGCRAKALNRYLRSIEPEILILNGDIIDIWQFRKRYWPKSHMKVVHRIFKMLTQGTKIYYLTGNHDEMLRKFTDFKLGGLEIRNKLVLKLNDKKAWIFHGDVFDVSMKGSKWLAKLGGVGYDILIMLNSLINSVLTLFGRERVSFSAKIKNSVKKAVKYIDDFEQTAISIAIDESYDYVVCGHIHQPQIRKYSNEKGSILYLNSGDWIENLTALEYNNGIWKLHKEKDHSFDDDKDDLNESELPDPQTLLNSIKGKL